ncbi:cytochrome P450 2D14-like [Mercenaria mercenaria]|uniref:cytochrome P450 2D14-like n=1 Tax=Mercenaria mercenaria TaxID=6596 RepID=UPI00234E6B0C|nr:cytochrome P450 2D14-like [Mercenaria mercenaria]
MLVEIFCVLLGIFAVYLFFAKCRQNATTIDGPTGLPLIGCVLEFGHENMHSKFLNYAEKFGEIFLVKMLWENVVVLNSQQLIKEAFSDDKYKQQFNDRPEAFYGEHFLVSSQTVGSTPYGSAIFHRNARKQFVQSLHAYGTGVREFEEQFMTEIESFVTEMARKDGKVFDIQEDIKHTLSNTVSILLRGEPLQDSDLDMFWEHAEGADFFLNANVNVVMVALPVLRFLPGKYGQQYRRARKAFGKLVEYFEDIKSSFQPGKTRGLIQCYLEKRRQESMSGQTISFTDDKIVAQLSEVVVGGILTIRSMLTDSLLVLLNHPDVQTRIQKELDVHIGRDRLPALSDLENCPFLQAFEIEMERYLNAVPLLLPHLCREHVKLRNYDISANTTIIANVWYVHHDPTVWGDPWNFRPKRFLDESGRLLPGDHILRKSVLTFGYGRRSCPGELLGRTRNMLYIAAILQRFTLEFPQGYNVTCDPRLQEVYEMKFTIRAKQFLCCAKERR